MIGMIDRRRAAQSGSPVVTYLITEESNKPVYDVCVAQGWCGAEGMTYEEAANVTNINTVFQYNTSISHFEEFSYFGVTNLSSYSFRGCTNLEIINLPPIKIINSNAFTNNRALKHLIFPSNLTEINNTALSNTTALQYVVFNSVTPPSMRYGGTVATLFESGNYQIYVPDASVNAYKTAWSDVASRIYPLSEFVEPT